MNVTAIIELESSREEGIGLWYVLKIRKVRFYWIGVEWEFQRAEPSRILEVEIHICVCIINIYIHTYVCTYVYINDVCMYVYGPLSVCFKYLTVFQQHCAPYLFRRTTLEVSEQWWLL